MIKNVTKKWIGVIVIIGLCAGGYYWYRKSKTTSNTLQYVTATAEKGTLISSVSGSGNVIVDQSANIDPTITGTVASLAVNVGDQVKKGQLLFTIVNDQLGVNVSKSVASVKQAQSSLESANAQRKQASADLEAAKKKKNTKTTTTTGAETKTTVTYSKSSDKQISALEEKLDAADASILSAEQSLSSAQADLQFQRENADKRKVLAPIDGTVNAVNIKNGDDLSKLSSGSSRQVPIILGDLNTLKAQVQVNEVDISNVTIGQKATLTFQAISGFTATGKVEKMDSLGTNTQGVITYNVIIGFDSLNERIKPDMTVSAAIINEVKQNVLLVPNSAVKTQNGSSIVQVLSSGQTPQQASVQIGLTNNSETEIISGINAGDKVVTQTINPNATSTTTRTQSSGIRIPGVGGGGRPD